MHRPGLIAALALALVAHAGSARAEEPDAAASLDAHVADTELGADLGLRMGGRSTPGGFHLGANFLYRVSDAFSSESTVAFTLGGGNAACFRDRGDDVLCDHGQLDGVAGTLATGLRWMAPVKQGFVPYARGMIGLELVNFDSDDVKGISVPVVLGAGVRTRVSSRIAVGGGADLHVGIAKLGRDIGVDPQVALRVRFGVEFAL